MRGNWAVKVAFTDTEMSVIYVGNRCMKNLEKRRKKEMAKTMNETQKRIRIIEKLISLGITNEEQIKKITPNDLLKSADISFEELIMIYDLQECVKKNRVFSFLAEKND